MFEKMEIFEKEDFITFKMISNINPYKMFSQCRKRGGWKCRKLVFDVLKKAVSGWKDSGCQNGQTRRSDNPK
jgi:hypothetical protein